MSVPDPGQDPAPGGAASPEEPGWIDRLRATFGLADAPDLRTVITEALARKSSHATGLSPQERTMLRNMLRFGALRIEEVMVPRADIVAMDEATTIAEALRIFEQEGHSRIPVFRGTLDNPCGMILTKDVLIWLVTEARQSEGETPESGFALDLSRLDLSRSIGSLGIVREVLFVPSAMPAADLFLQMQTTRIHLALVVDEYGGTDGLVSSEDLVEEVVGEIEDEHDVDDDPLIHDDASLGLVADARTPVEDLERRLGLDLMPEAPGDEVETIGGLVFTLAGRIPAQGETVAHPAGIGFEVLDADSRRIRKLIVHEAGSAPRSKEQAPASTQSGT